MDWKNYVLRVVRYSHRYRDDWGVETENYEYLDAELDQLEVGTLLEPVYYVSDSLPRRKDGHTKLECLAIEDNLLKFKFYFLENYKGVEIGISPETEAREGGSSDRHSASYTITLIPKNEYKPKQGETTYI